jgi:hypothetical protein
MTLAPTIPQTKVDSFPAPSVGNFFRNIGKAAYLATAKMAGYRAAYPTNTTRTAGWIGTNQNSTFARIQVVGMNWTAEDVFKNSSIASAYIGTRINYCSSQMTYIPSTGDAKLDADLRSYLHGDDGHGGVFGNMGIDGSMQDAFSRTADLETPIRGDAGLVWLDDGFNLRLMEFSADQLGEVFSFTTQRRTSLQMTQDGLKEVAGSDCAYYAGRYFRGCDCIAYKIYERTNSWYGSPKIYPACDVIYFHDPSSFRGVRGITKFATAIQHMEKGETLFQTGMDAALRQSKTAMMIFNESGAPDSGAYETVTGANGQVGYRERIPNGPLTEYFYNGDSAQFMSPDSPGPELIAGVEKSDERVALALWMNYAFLIAATKVGGAPSRLEINKASKELARIQNKIHRPRLSRISQTIIRDAVRRGIFPAIPTITSGRWQLPISPSVDAFYDAKENIAMSRAGIEAQEDIIAETNRDAEDVLQKRGKWAMKVAMTVEDSNKQLVALGYKPTITTESIAQNSDNPQQAAIGGEIDEGKVQITDAGKVAGKSTAKLSFDESKHPRVANGEFGFLIKHGNDVSAALADAKQIPVEHAKKILSDISADHWIKLATALNDNDHETIHALTKDHIPASVAKLAFDESKHPRGQPENAGEFGNAAGSPAKQLDASKSGKKNLAPSKEKAWSGTPVEIKNKLSKLESGALGEKIVTDWLKDQGFADARTLNADRNNFPIDLVQDHEVIEVKTGMASNGETAMQWRATIGQPGPEETKWLKTASSEDKKAHNAKKAQAILDRKAQAVKEVSEKLGRKVKGKTVCLIFNPDKKTVDLYEFDGFHSRIPWNSDLAKNGYRGSFQYA